MPDKETQDLVNQMAAEIRASTEEGIDEPIVPTDSDIGDNPDSEAAVETPAPGEESPLGNEIPSEDTEDDEVTEDDTEEAETEEESANQDDEPQASNPFGDVPPEDAQVALSLLNWRKGLTADQTQGIDLLLTGQYQLVPVNQPQSQGVEGSQRSGVADDSDEFIDEAAKRRIIELEQRLDAITTTTQQSQQYVAQQAQAALQAQMDQGIAAFKESKGLDDTEIQDLITKTAHYNILPGIQASVRNETGMDNGALAVQRALDMVYRADDKYQQRELESLLEQERVQAQDRQQKKRKASSLTGKGGSVSREPAAPATKEDRFSAMVADIAAATQQ